MAALHQLGRDGAEAVLVSRADKPALARLDDELFEVRPVDVAASGQNGCAGALNVTRRGRGTGRRDAIAGLVDVRLVPIEDPDDRTTPDRLAERTIH